MIQRFTVSRDDDIYEAFPDVALATSGRLVCVFSECTHHRDRSYTRIAVTHSDDRGRTWSPKRGLTEPLEGDPNENPWWNCPRISALSDGRLAMVVDRITGREMVSRKTFTGLYLSEDEGETWSDPVPTPAVGIVPDQLVELKHGEFAGRWILSCHNVIDPAPGRTWRQQCWYSDDRGRTWSKDINIAMLPKTQLCEGSVCELPGGELVCFMRENSGQGWDAFKAVSVDGGRKWSAAIRFPLPGCHRPVAGMLNNGQVLVTHRFMQGGKGWVGWWTQNFFAGLTDVESCLAESRREAHSRILPIDFDRHPESDTGYSGWVQFPDGEIYIVNYILDDAPKAQIRGYALTIDDFITS